MEDSNDNEFIERFNIEENDFKDFISNKLPEEINLKYHKLDSNNRLMNRNGNFISSYYSKEEFLSYHTIFISFIFSITFYLLLISVLLTMKTWLIVFLIFIYFTGSFLQFGVIPTPYEYGSKVDFETKLNNIIHGSAKIRFFQIKNKEKKNFIIYPAKYSTDITGTINIPKNISYARILDVQFYTEFDYKNFYEQYKKIYSKFYCEAIISNENKIININRRIYSLNSNSSSSSVNFYTTICCLLLLQWLNAFIKSFCSNKIVIICPAKLITKEFALNSKTCICVHGKKIIPEQFNTVEINLERNEKFENKYKTFEKKEKIRKEKEEEERKKKEEERKKEEEERYKRLKEEEERKLDEERNTENLSVFYNNNYKIKVYRIYDDVHLKMWCRTAKGPYEYESYLGYYDKDFEENIKDEGNCTIYYPKGFNIKIEVTNFENRFNVKIGTEFTKSFLYKD